MGHQKRKRPAEILCTGMIKEDFVKQAKKIRRAELERREIPQMVRQCYLCKRREGDISFKLDLANCEFLFSPLEVDVFRMSNIPGGSACFCLCHECTVFLVAVSKTHPLLKDKSKPSRNHGSRRKR